MAMVFTRLSLLHQLNDLVGTGRTGSTFEFDFEAVLGIQSSVRSLSHTHCLSTYTTMVMVGV